jgi:hypothetical protein
MYFLGHKGWLHFISNEMRQGIRGLDFHIQERSKDRKHHLYVEWYLMERQKYAVMLDY